MQSIINGHNYDIGKLNAKQQFHVVRRLAPLLAKATDVLHVAQKLSDTATPTDDESLHMLGTAGEAFAALPEQDVDYIIAACLGVTRRQSQGGTGWCTMTTASGELMFADLPMIDMLHIVVAVLKESLGDFFAALPQTPPTAAAVIPRPAAG